MAVVVDPINRRVALMGGFSTSLRVKDGNLVSFDTESASIVLTERGYVCKRQLPHSGTLSPVRYGAEEAIVDLRIERLIVS